MTFQIASIDHKGVLTLTGDLTIEKAAEIRKALLATLDDHDQVAIRLDSVTAVDLSCLQLLCSAHRTALGRDKKISLDLEDADFFERIVRESGFWRKTGCRTSRAKSCMLCGGMEG